MAQRMLVEPRQYAVGTDITAEQYQDALLKIADWFTESRKTKEPALLAKQLFQLCFDGVTKSGKPWFSAANATLEARVRSMCRFDLLTMQPLRTGSEKTRKKKEKEQARQDKKRRNALEDPLIPDEVRKDLRNSATYGDNPNVFLSSEEEQQWRDLYNAYRQQFPELSTVNAEAELKLLCDLHTLSERQRMKLLQGQKVDVEERAAVSAELQRLKKALGIHPDQLVKRTKLKTDTSIGAAAARLESMGDYRKLRERFWVEELLQIWVMYMTPSADGLSYQLDEVGLFGLTRSKPCACPKCGHKVFAGLSIDEIEDWLVSKGALKRLDPVEVASDPARTASTG